MEFKKGDIVRLDDSPMDWIGCITQFCGTGEARYPLIRWMLLYGVPYNHKAIPCGFKTESVKLYDRTM